jgi:16S rRNA (cytidine1402-2'-O)-methyltransferase
MIHTPMPEAPPGTLYVVATPLGNLEDITLRALRVLRQVSLVACEDTRRTARLLGGHGIAAATTSYHEHNAAAKGARIIAELQAGRDVALVSDAGTPGISDPGQWLVREARAAGVPVVPVPGPSAAVAALSVAGLSADRFLFVGFLPSRAEARRRALAELAPVQDALVVYESPRRVVAALEDMQAAWGDREAFLCREATKLHEEYRSGHLSTLRESLRARDEVRGEVVLVVAGSGPTADPATDTPEALFAQLVSAGRTRREAVKETARRLRLPARDVYRRVLNDG